MNKYDFPMLKKSKHTQKTCGMIKITKSHHFISKRLKMWWPCLKNHPGIVDI